MVNLTKQDTLDYLGLCHGGLTERTIAARTSLGREVVVQHVPYLGVLRCHGAPERLWDERLSKVLSGMQRIKQGFA